MSIIFFWIPFELTSTFISYHISNGYLSMLSYLEMGRYQNFNRSQYWYWIFMSTDTDSWISELFSTVWCVRNLYFICPRLHELKNYFPSALCSKNFQTTLFFGFPIFHTSLSLTKIVKSVQKNIYSSLNINKLNISNIQRPRKRAPPLPLSKKALSLSV